MSQAGRVYTRVYVSSVCIHNITYVFIYAHVRSSSNSPSFFLSLSLFLSLSFSLSAPFNARPARPGPARPRACPPACLRGWMDGWMDGWSILFRLRFPPLCSVRRCASRTRNVTSLFFTCFLPSIEFSSVGRRWRRKWHASLSLSLSLSLKHHH